ncbi:hypothetical protein [Ensifer aridi]|uniref:hypothetical protein n=1 Tax=Ensifer aridi TaxID=1708715 RepID=UPI001FCDA6BC|nr:hypothetical protein [Ensifer aridi]
MADALKMKNAVCGDPAAQEDLGKRVDRRGLNAGPEQPVAIDLGRFTASLKTAWQAGENRPTHRRPYRRTKPYPKRATMLEPFEPQIRTWLEVDPALSAALVLQRLISAAPSRFTEKSLRAVQMAVKAWRMEITGQIILDGDWMKRATVSPPPAAEEVRAISVPLDRGNILGCGNRGGSFSFRPTVGLRDASDGGERRLFGPFKVPPAATRRERPTRTRSPWRRGLGGRAVASVAALLTKVDPGVTDRSRPNAAAPRLHWDFRCWAKAVFAVLSTKLDNRATNVDPRRRPASSAFPDETSSS